MTRIATALVLIPAMVGLALFAPLWALAAALGLAGAFAMLEYDRIAQAAFAGIWPRLAGIVYVFGPLACAILLWRIGRHWLMFALLDRRYCRNVCRQNVGPPQARAGSQPE